VNGRQEVGLPPRQPELDPRHGGHQRLVHVLDAFDEVRLAEDEVDGFGFFDN
jgi:hypothetical protein